MDKAADAISESTTVLHAQAPSVVVAPEPMPDPPQIDARLPEQQEDVRTYTVPLNTNGTSLTSTMPVTTDGYDTAQRS